MPVFLRKAPELRGALRLRTVGGAAAKAAEEPRPPPSPAPLPRAHTASSPARREVSCAGGASLAGIAQCPELQRHSRGQLPKLSNSLLMTGGLQHPTQTLCYFKLCCGIWAFHRTRDHRVYNSHRAAPPPPGTMAPSASLPRPVLEVEFSILHAAQGWPCETAPGSSWSFSQGQRSQLCGRFMTSAHCTGGSVLLRLRSSGLHSCIW